jgi:hypothetical protein
VTLINLDAGTVLSGLQRIAENDAENDAENNLGDEANHHTNALGEDGSHDSANTSPSAAADDVDNS